MAFNQCNILYLSSSMIFIKLLHAFMFAFSEKFVLYQLLDLLERLRKFEQNDKKKCLECLCNLFHFQTFQPSNSQSYIKDLTKKEKSG